MELKRNICLIISPFFLSNTITVTYLFMINSSLFCIISVNHAIVYISRFLPVEDTAPATADYVIEPDFQEVKLEV